MSEPVAAWPPMRRDAKSAEFFDAAACEELLIKKCGHCGQALPPEATVCTTCGHIDLSWAPAAGTATLVSWTVVHRAPNSAFAALVPYTVGIVELTEGPWLYGRITGTLSEGTALRTEFVHTDDGESYPVFAAQEA